MRERKLNVKMIKVSHEAWQELMKLKINSKENLCIHEIVDKLLKIKK
jgi:hypothetical protein